MSATYYDDYVEGWTAGIEYDLMHKNPATGAESTFDASGMSISILLKDKDNNTISFSGTVAWSDQSNSRAKFNPASGDFLRSKSPYSLWWKVTDASSKVAYYPQGEPIKVTVY